MSAEEEEAFSYAEQAGLARVTREYLPGDDALAAQRLMYVPHMKPGEWYHFVTPAHTPAVRVYNCGLNGEIAIDSNGDSLMSGYEISVLPAGSPVLLFLLRTAVLVPIDQKSGTVIHINELDLRKIRYQLISNGTFSSGDEATIYADRMAKNSVYYRGPFFPALAPIFLHNDRPITFFGCMSYLQRMENLCT